MVTPNILQMGINAPGSGIMNFDDPKGFPGTPTIYFFGAAG
jgi:hypothetical protein